jgi:hypothetical protein
MPATLRAAVLLFGSALIAVPAAGQVLETVGTRALGMGGAFVAVADDGSATYWNPAGLASGAMLDAGLGYGRADFRAGGGPEAAGGEAGTRSVWLVMPALGLSYNRLRVTTAAVAGSSTAAEPGDRQDLRPRGVGVSSLVAGQYGITLVQSLAPGIAVGSTLKLVRATAATDLLPAGAGREEALERGRQAAGRGQTAVDADIDAGSDWRAAAQGEAHHAGAAAGGAELSEGQRRQARGLNLVKLGSSRTRRSPRCSASSTASPRSTSASSRSTRRSSSWFPPRPRRSTRSSRSAAPARR